MTPGTSPHGGSPSNAWTDAIENLARAARLWPPAAASFEINWPWLARRAAALLPLGLGLFFTVAWHDPAGAGEVGGGLPMPHLAFLIATGVAAAFLTLGSSKGGAGTTANDETATGAGVSQLLAQMSHELRTPLNAVIGFSEVMLRELHGPLGHARYQEYAAHISESGGQLLKASEDTLAVTATMSALMANRTGGRRERVSAATLVREAWGRAAAGAPSRDIQLAVTSCNSCAIECERRATSQALEHLLREAFAKVPAAGAVEVRGRRKSGARSIEICVTGPGASEALSPAASGLPASPGRSADPLVAGGSLRVMLARLLLEMQGATVSVWDGHDGVSWSACVAFPPRG